MNQPITSQDVQHTGAIHGSETENSGSSAKNVRELTVMRQRSVCMLKKRDKAALKVTPWNVNFVVIRAPINTVKPVKGLSDIGVQIASKPSQKALAPYKFGKIWEQTKVTLRLVVSYFNWIWQHSTTKTTTAQRSQLTENPWTWHDIAICPTLL